jgi:hypothetical protein
MNIKENLIVHIKIGKSQQKTEQMRHIIYRQSGVDAHFNFSSSE